MLGGQSNDWSKFPSRALALSNSWHRLPGDRADVMCVWLPNSSGIAVLCQRPYQLITPGRGTVVGPDRSRKGIAAAIPELPEVTSVDQALAILNGLRQPTPERVGPEAPELVQYLEQSTMCQ